MHGIILEDLTSHTVCMLHCGVSMYHTCVYMCGYSVHAHDVYTMYIYIVCVSILLYIGVCNNFSSAIHVHTCTYAYNVLLYVHVYIFIQATYKLLEDGTFEPRFLSCFAGDFECEDDSTCILRQTLAVDVFYYCCCTENYCNGHLTVILPSPVPSEPVDPQPSNDVLPSLPTDPTSPSETATASATG